MVWFRRAEAEIVEWEPNKWYNISDFHSLGATCRYSFYEEYRGISTILQTEIKTPCSWAAQNSNFGVIAKRPKPQSRLCAQFLQDASDHGHSTVERHSWSA